MEVPYIVYMESQKSRNLSVNLSTKELFCVHPIITRLVLLISNWIISEIGVRALIDCSRIPIRKRVYRLSSQVSNLLIKCIEQKERLAYSIL